MGCKPRIGMTMVRALTVLLSALGCSNHSIGATNWISGSYTVTMDTVITNVGESFSGSSELSLAHDTQCTLIVSATGGSQELKNAGGSKLTTRYRLTGVTGGPNPLAVTGGPSCTIANSGVTFTAPGVLNINIPHNSTTPVNLSGAAAMNPSSANGCQGQTFTIPVSITVKQS